VVAFEPQPAVFELLRANVASWSGDLAAVELHQTAISDRAGTGSIVSGPLFEHNMGLAKLGEADADGSLSHEVEVQRLDELLGDTQVGVMKVDVEGHETEVLRGAGRLLKRRLVRDIVFEDHGDYPSEATAIVEQAGYHLVSLANDLGGLRLRAPQDRGAAPAWPGPSYLATVDPGRSLPRLRARGWQVRGIGIGLRR
jgi:FkbM family methyltransferase